MTDYHNLYMLIPDDTFQFCCVGISQAGARCVEYKIKVLHIVLVSTLSQGDHPLLYKLTWIKSTLSCLEIPILDLKLM